MHVWSQVSFEFVRVGEWFGWVSECFERRMAATQLPAPGCCDAIAQDFIHTVHHAMMAFQVRVGHGMACTGLG